MTVEEIIKIAKDCGFDEVNVMNPQTLTPMEMVRDTCKTDKCGAYGKNWGCPPHRSIEEDEAYLKSFEHGLIMQCVGKSDKRIDFEMYQETGDRLTNAIRALHDIMKKEYPNCITLGAGGCKFCKTCARPEPCRFPDKKIEALEGYGIFITQLCRDNDVTYYYGEGTIAYTSALLW